MSPQLTAALDRTKVSNRGATHIVAAAASTLGHDANSLAINRESIRRARMKHRAAVAQEIRNSFSPDAPLSVHWDGKMVLDVTGGKVDRLAIIVSGDGVDKLLAVPKLLNGSGQAQAEAVLEALRDWEVEDRVIALSFDTTASNTGHISGACTIIEQAVGRQLLNLACRHHILELVVEKAFSECLGPSTGPDIGLFVRFRERWPLLSTTVNDLKPLEEEDAIKPLLEEREELHAKFKNHLLEGQPRDDYRELLELSIIILGGVPPRGIHLLRPGALHRARWMAKIIYALKIWLMREQMNLTAKEKAGLRRFINFILLLYVTAWFAARQATGAPANDLRFYQSLAAYSTVDKPLSKAVTNTFGRHLWYLSEHLVALALFHPNTPADVLQEMVTAMTATGGAEGGEEPPKKAKLDASSAKEKRLSDFTSSRSTLLLDRLGCGRDFLKLPPAQWRTNQDFLRGQRRAKSLAVINDLAERGVALMQNYNLKLTKDESQQQFLIQ